MSQILSGAMDTLPFSYTLSKQRVPYADEAALGLTDDDRMTELPGAASDGAEDGNFLPLLFDDVTVTSPVVVSGQVVNRAGYMVLTEEAVISYRTRCARCLTDVESSTAFRVEKPVADEKGPMSLENRDNDDYVQIKDGKLDLDAVICDEILLSFPMRILCKDDCKGLCAGCGADLNTEVCRCTKKEIDPRFASLAALLDSMPDDDDEGDN